MCTDATHCMLILYYLVLVKIEECGSTLSFSSLSFSFYFSFTFHFSTFRTLGLGLEVISHTVTSVTSDGMVTTLIMGLKRRR